MLWIALYLPGLSLQAHCRSALGQLRDLPLVISDGPANRPLVHAANAPARAAGIAAAMSVSSAQAHAIDLVVIAREPQRETEALRQMATWLTQFTPMVCFEAAGVLLEVSTSLTLFGGIAALTQRIRSGVLALNFQPAIGIAPTPRAAYLLARASHYHAGVRMCREAGQLRERLDPVPLALYDWPQADVQTMAALGFTRVKDLLAQPRAGLRKRFDAALMDDLDRSLGLLPDPRQPFVPPEQFESRLELLFETADAGRLCHFTHLLLNEMEGFLRARGTAVSAIELDMKHSRDSHTRHEFGARTPQRKAAEWLRLVRERFTAHELPAAVTAISLSARAPQAYVPTSESWLPTRQAQQEQWQVLLARIASRLGEKRVFGISAHDDHRPELAWRIADAHATARTGKAAAASKARPLMLLQEPRALVSMDGAPQHHGSLTLLAGPERIETGWWDGRPVARDYFVARNRRHEVCWIYRDYRNDRRWFLHGYFA